MVIQFFEDQLLNNSENIPEEELFEIFELIKNIRIPRITSILIRLYTEKVTVTQLSDRSENKSHDEYSNDPVNKVHLWICEALALHQSDLPYENLIMYLMHDRIEEYEKSRIMTSLLALKDKLTYSHIERIARAENIWCRLTASVMIGERRRISEINLLGSLLDDKTVIVKQAAIEAINKLTFHGAITFFGKMKSTTLTDSLPKKYENSILGKTLLEFHLLSSPKEQISSIVTDVIQDNVPIIIEGLVEFLQKYSNDEILETFSPLLETKYNYISRMFTKHYLNNKINPCAELIFKMLRHRDKEVKILTAVYLLSGKCAAL